MLAKGKQLNREITSRTNLRVVLYILCTRVLFVVLNIAYIAPSITKSSLPAVADGVVSGRATDDAVNVVLLHR